MSLSETDPTGLDSSMPSPRPTNTESNGCCKSRRVDFICRAMPAAANIPFLKHCYLVFVDENGDAVDVISGQNVDGMLGQSDVAWDQQYYDGLNSNVAQTTHPVAMPLENLCETNDCLNNAMAAMHGDTPYAQGVNNSNTILSLAMFQCGVTAAFPRGAIGAVTPYDMGTSCVKNCLDAAGPPWNTMQAYIDGCTANCQVLNNPSEPFVPLDPYEDAPPTFNPN